MTGERPTTSSQASFNVGYYGLAQILNATLAMLLIGFLTRTLGRTGFGEFSFAFVVASIGVLSVDPGHVLFAIPVETKAPGSAPFSSVGEQVYLALALLIGLASGPIQSSSRTLLARMCPPGKTTE